MYTVEKINEVILNGSFNLVEKDAPHGSFGEYIGKAEMVYFSDSSNLNRNYFKDGDKYYLVTCTKDFKSVSLYEYQLNN